VPLARHQPCGLFHPHSCASRSIDPYFNSCARAQHFGSNTHQPSRSFTVFFMKVFSPSTGYFTTSSFDYFNSNRDAIAVESISFFANRLPDPLHSQTPLEAFDSLRSHPDRKLRVLSSSTISIARRNEKYPRKEPSRCWSPRPMPPSRIGARGLPFGLPNTTAPKPIYPSRGLPSLGHARQVAAIPQGFEQSE